MARCAIVTEPNVTTGDETDTLQLYGDQLEMGQL